jgi:hypothetical protein
MVGVKLWPDGQAVAFPDNREAIKRARETVYYINEEGERVEVIKKKTAYNEQKRARTHSKAMERKIFCGVRALKIMSPGACFFTVTSAGRPGAISGAEIDALFTYLRNVHGLDQYLWVREKTKAGTDHLHVVALFKPGYRMQYWIGKGGKAPEVSEWWSRRLGMPPARNSIRFGWYDRQGRRRFYISKDFGGGYCAKYLTKDSSRGPGYRRLGLSEQVNKYAKPITYYARWRCRYEKREILDWRVQKITETVPEYWREWPDAPEYIEKVLARFSWRKVENIELGYYIYFGRSRHRLPLIEASEIIRFMASKYIEFSEN